MSYRTLLYKLNRTFKHMQSTRERDKEKAEHKLRFKNYRHCLTQYKCPTELFHTSS